MLYEKFPELKYITTIEELVKINDIENPEIIIIGQKLIIPGRAIF